MRLITVLLVLHLLAPPLQARQLTPVEGLEELRKAFAGLGTFSAEISQEKQVRLLKKKLTTTGIIRFRQPDSFYMELNPPHASRILLQDATLSVNLTAEGVKQRIVLPPEQGLKQWFSSFSRPVTRLPDGVEVRGEAKDGTTRLTIAPKQKGQLKELGIVLAGGELKTLTLEDGSGNRTVIKVHRFRRNPPLTDADFRVEPP